MTHDGPRIHDPDRVRNVEVNAFQRLSGVIVQKSLPEDSGLVASEAMWKGAPVVAGRLGGIALQMAGGTGGLLVDTSRGHVARSRGWSTRGTRPS
jgi:glycosyltransferase involved in cell wall biosynthesis